MAPFPRRCHRGANEKRRPEPCYGYPASQETIMCKWYGGWLLVAAIALGGMRNQSTTD